MHLTLVEYVMHPFNIVRDGTLHHCVTILLAIHGCELQLGCKYAMNLLNSFLLVTIQTQCHRELIHVNVQLISL